MSGVAAGLSAGSVRSSVNSYDSTDESASVSSAHNQSFIQNTCETLAGMVVGKYKSGNLDGLNDALLEGRMLLGEKLHEQDTKLELGDLDLQNYLHTHLSRFYETHGHFEALLSGKHHRVYGVFLPAAKGRTCIPFIIRVPHSQNPSRMSERGIGVLQLVETFAQIPVPRLIAYSFNPETSLARAWSLQSRCPGYDLCSNEMNYWMLEPPSQIRIAVALGTVIRTLLNTSFRSPGELRIHHGNSNATTVSVEPFLVYLGLSSSIQSPRVRGIYSGYGSRPQPPSTSEWLISQLKRWRAAALPEHTEIPDYLDCLMRVVKQMRRMKLFAHDKYSLCHFDLHPRNIIADKDEYDMATITGIVDWDSAVIAPSFAQCAPPSWLWYCGADFSTDNGGPLAEQFPVRQPLYAQHCALKDIFDQAAGPEYCAFAYSSKYRLARTMFRFALNGIYEALYVGDVDQFLLEWSLERDPRMPVIQRPFIG